MKKEEKGNGIGYGFYSLSDSHTFPLYWVPRFSFNPTYTELLLIVYRLRF